MKKETFIKGLPIVLILILIIPSVYADGWHISDYYLHLYEPNQKAVISWNGQMETMILSSAVKSDDIANFAWVIPIQSYTKPEVTGGNISIFKDLVNYFRIEENYGRDQLGIESTGGKGVEVVESKEVDVYDITILKATSSDDLIDWLNDNGYKVPDEAKPILDKYVAKGNFYFVANKIDLRNKFKNEINFLTNVESGKVADDTYLSNLSFDELLNRFSYDYELETMAVSIYRDFSGKKITNSSDYGNFIRYQSIYSFLSKDFMESFLEENSEYIKNVDRKDSYEISANWWSNIAASFEPELRGFYVSKVNKEPGIYCGLGENSNLIYSSPEITKSPVSIGHCSYFPEQKRNLIQEKIPDFYESYKENKEDLKEEYDKVFTSQNTSIHNLYELRKTVSDLKMGLGTPLKFEFQPSQPYYPLEISSLNIGESFIEVYVLTENPVSDKNNILEVGESKEINSELREKLEQHIDLSNANYVTRLSYNGDLNNLTSDAEFKYEEPTYEEEYRFLEALWNWISNLFK